MSVEPFLKLKEIDSLTKMRNNYLKHKSEQEDRVSRLNDKRQDCHLRTAKLKHELISTNNDLADVEKKISTFTEQKQRLVDIGGDDKKIASYQEEINTLETKGFEFLSNIETIENELSEIKTFEQGLEKTIQEIQSEVSGEIEKINNELVNIKTRLDLLMDELPVDYKNLLVKITAKNLAHGPFTRVDQGSCFFCRFKISRIEESEIDMQKNLKTCPQCSRIFLPYGA